MIKKIEKVVEEIKEWVLPNGYTFLALTSSSGGYSSWAKATDPVTAMREAYKDYINNVSSRDNKIAIFCFYGKNDGLNASGDGGYEWQSSNPPLPIGIFAVSKSSIRAVKKGDFNDEHDDCLGWASKKITHFDQQKSEEDC